MDMLREAADSKWVKEFLRAFKRRRDCLAGGHELSELLPVAREGIFQYLRERYGMVLREQLPSVDDVDKQLRSIADEAVIVKPRHRSGAYCIVGRWLLSELGDTHDGEYELAAG